jgi:antitoxin component YwqK of YwqJK toxin-antitoxin module
MRPDKRYKSSIPPQSEERVLKRFDNGGPRTAEYYLDGKLVGFREFFPSGEPQQERAYKDGVRHGVEYDWFAPGYLVSAEPYENGVPHGVACQWGEKANIIGTYTMDRGTGIDFWRNEWMDGTVTLSEVHYMKDGRPHGWEWWLDYDQKSVDWERFWQEGELHGIERQWNSEGKLSRGFPKYWIRSGGPKASLLERSRHRPHAARFPNGR